jgi:Raf kinase inhibitor-like YbhB/YbcL family protein
MKRIHCFVVFWVLFGVSSALAGNFELTSQSLQKNGTLPFRQVFNGFGCTGDNLSPDLSWHGEPAGTKSFAITVYDPDAPTGSGWWHWLVFNIPGDIHSLLENSGNPEKGLMPKQAIQARTDFGTSGYGGACPPAGTQKHRYQFTVWALDVEQLPLTADTTGAMLGFNLRQHVLAQAELTVTYGR